ncbi:tyrosine-protein phosphatase [Vagococcus carniphilus]|uniref:Tyrosine-protein phosphatase n=1 Tax=Vagococcus carniphilus TaxID=218144 RepID=A0A430B8R0_9ENTE|nr:CpsB/CapC family capsule biosynthesis tyrosine phosphatase [Vagococcus carniphilus]QNN73739.1 tyrosine protein phosphatase [Vagococcus carniphilus]RSU16736.1 tyrosine protein phosphatase [Vagococcus carniphilus]
MLVDIHCHILPGIDDGAQTIEDSLAMAELAVSEGITHILCTPHHNNGVYMNKKDQVIPCVSELQTVLDEKKIPLTLYEGQEVRISHDLLKRVAQNEILFTDLDDTYILIEFPSSEVPLYAHRVLFDLCTNGYKPVIVHPERNGQIMKNPNLMIPFIEMGCLGQVTCASYTGQFGKEIQKVSKVMIEHNLVHMLASDAHSTGHRSFFTKEAYDKLEKEFGDEKCQYFKQTVKDIVNGEKTTILPHEEYKKKFKLFG